MGEGKEGGKAGGSFSLDFMTTCGRTLTLGLARRLLQLLFLLLLLSHDVGVTLFALFMCQSVLLFCLVAALLLRVPLPSQFALIATSHFTVRKWLSRGDEEK